MGEWPWMQPRVLEFLSSIGIEIRGDGTCEDDGIAEFARRYPIKGRRCGGKRRGCIEVVVDKFNDIKVANKSLQRAKKSRSPLNVICEVKNVL